MQTARMHLLYVYAWMPYPRRVILYLRERGIPSDIVRVVTCKDPQEGSVAEDGFPPAPHTGLPLLAIPPSSAKPLKIPSSLDGWQILRQSQPIMHYLERQYPSWNVPRVSTYSMFSEKPDDALRMAIVEGYSILAESALQTWNPVRNFGSHVGPELIPNAAKESLKWVHRELANVEQYLDPESGVDLDYGGYERRLAEDSNAGPIFGDVLLLSFLEMVDDLYKCFNKLTLGGGQKGKDAYGRTVDGYGTYPNIRKFYALYRARRSAIRNADKGEEVPAKYIPKASLWIQGLF